MNRSLAVFNVLIILSLGSVPCMAATPYHSNEIVTLTKFSITGCTGDLATSSTPTDENFNILYRVVLSLNVIIGSVISFSMQPRPRHNNCLFGTVSMVFNERPTTGNGHWQLLMLPQSERCGFNPHGARQSRLLCGSYLCHIASISRLIPGLRPANERRRYFVTASLIGWAQG